MKSKVELTTRVYLGKHFQSIIDKWKREMRLNWEICSQQGTENVDQTKNKWFSRNFWLDEFFRYETSEECKPLFCFNSSTCDSVLKIVYNKVFYACAVSVV